MSQVKKDIADKKAARVNIPVGPYIIRKKAERQHGLLYVVHESDKGHQIVQLSLAKFPELPGIQILKKVVNLLIDDPNMDPKEKKNELMADFKAKNPNWASTSSGTPASSEPTPKSSALASIATASTASAPTPPQFETPPAKSCRKRPAAADPVQDLELPLGSMSLGDDDMKGFMDF
eukprot:7731551-Alexandrium_andersonii.AAC.1